MQTPVAQKNEITWGDVWRKVFGALCSMGFSLILLGVLLAACVAGSILPQGSSESVYAQQFGAAAAKIIAVLGLDNVFGCWWFVAAAALLGLNLTLCSLIRAPKLWRRWRSGFVPGGCVPHPEIADFTLTRAGGAAIDLAALGCRKGQIKSYTAPDGSTWQYAAQHTAGLWGSWLCHLGMLLIMAGFALGRLLTTEAVVYGIPGSTQPVGDTGYSLTIDDFDVALREDYTVEQYTAALTLSAADGRSVSGQASVNHPMSAFGFSLYQDSTGWACYVDTTYNGVAVQQDLLCAGEYTAPATMPGLVLMFNKFYPDLQRTADGGLTTATPLLQNPHALYSLYYNGQMLTMDLCEMDTAIEVDGYAFTLHDPVQYTLIVVRRDPTAWFVAVAGAVMVLGIMLAFYCRPHQLWTDGKTLYAKADKAPALLRQALEARLNRPGQGGQRPGSTDNVKQEV